MLDSVKIQVGNRVLRAIGHAQKDLPCPIQIYPFLSERLKFLLTDVIYVGLVLHEEEFNSFYHHIYISS